MNWSSIRNQRIAAILFAGTIGSMMYLSRPVGALELLAERGVQTKGIVTALVPTGEDVHYRFVDHGATHHGTGTAGWRTPPFAELKAGDSVIVAYLPYNPDVSTLGDAASRRNSERRKVLLRGLLLSVTSLVILWPRRQATGIEA